MRRVLATISILAFSGFASAGSAEQMPVAQSQTAPGKGAAKAAPKAAKTPSTAATVAARLGSMMIGGVVGTPICMVRRSQEETLIATKELVGDTKHKWLYVAAAPLGFVGGVVSGVFQGPIFASYHACKYSDQPFSKEVFSLGDAK